MIYIKKENSLPENLGKIELNVDEMMFFMYLPIKFPKHKNILDIRENIPERLSFIYELISKIWIDRPEDFDNNYVYLTVKNTYVSPSSMSQRMGWHIDGFMTEDINYIWYSDVPTEFAEGNFNLTEDHSVSLIEMESQVNEVKTYPNMNILRLNDSNVHRVNESHDYEGMRMFIKISFSKHKYNLSGNSHNYLLDYDWNMARRGEVRNMESDNYSNGDFSE